MENLKAALCASTSSVIVFQPLDLIRTKFSVSQGKQKLSNFVKQIFNKEGLKGFYKGLSLQLIANPLSTSLYFVLYEKLKSKNFCDNQKSKIVLSSILSGAISNSLTHPLWTLKNKLQTQNNQKMLQIMKQTYNQQGIKGFYAGFLLSFVGISHVAIYFPVYEFLKEQLKSDNKGSDVVLSSIGAKLIATTVSYPSNLLMVRKQCENQSLRRIVGELYRSQGIKGFFKGLKLDVMRSIPANALTFFVYESLKQQNN